MITNKVRRLIKQMNKLRSQAPDYLAKRERLYQRIDSMTENGHVGLHIDAIDCDCAHYTRAWSIPMTSHRAVLREIERAYDDAEGMMTVSVVTPQFADTHEWTSRDLALEAFEEGHPHVVYI